MASSEPEGDYQWHPPSEAEMKLIEAKKERSDKISKLMGDYMLKGYKMLNAICSNCDTILLEDKQGQKHCVACIDLASDTHKDDPATNAQAALSKVLEHQRASNFKMVANNSSKVLQSNIVDLPGSYLNSGDCFHEEEPLPESEMKESGLRREKINRTIHISGENTRGVSMGQCGHCKECGTLLSRNTQVGSDHCRSCVEKSLSDEGFPGSSSVCLGQPSKLFTSIQAIPPERTQISPEVPAASATHTLLHETVADFASVKRVLCDKIHWATCELRKTTNVEYSIQLCQLIKASTEAILALKSGL